MIKLNDNEISIINKIQYNKTIFLDESGAGCMAGDLIIAGVMLPENHTIIGLNDSKKISSSKRDELYEEIKKQCIDFTIIRISPDEIDKINIFQARMLGFKKAIEKLKQAEFALIDGNKKPDNTKIPTYTIVKGDAKIDGIAAASILAKVERDRHIIEESIKYPQWQFDKHKGYGTKLHKDLLALHGICPIHRKSYKPVKEIFDRSNQK